VAVIRIYHLLRDFLFYLVSNHSILLAALTMLKILGVRKISTWNLFEHIVVTQILYVT